MVQIWLKLYHAYYKTLHLSPRNTGQLQKQNGVKAVEVYQQLSSPTVLPTTPT